MIIPVLRGNEFLREMIDARLGDLAVSAFVVAELRYGALKSSKVEINLRDIDELLEFVPIVPFDANCARIYSGLRLDLERLGRRTGELDLLIASVALAHNATLVTHNKKHFEAIDGLVIEDWLSP